jgi:hypothetical protein
MRPRDINPLKMKVYFELGPMLDPHEKGLVSIPPVQKISDKGIFFDEELSADQALRIRKIVLIFYILGKWKEYSLSQFELPLEESKKDPDRPSHFLSYVVEEGERLAFKNDMLLALR